MTGPAVPAPDAVLRPWQVAQYRASTAARLKAVTIDAWVSGSLALAAYGVDGLSEDDIETLLAAQLGTAVTDWAKGWAADNIASMDLTDAPDALTSLLDSISNASPDADADDQEQGAAAWASSAGAQEAMAQAGVTKWDSVANANACQICLDKESGGPYVVGGDAARPPYHNACDCESVPAKGSSDDS